MSLNYHDIFIMLYSIIILSSVTFKQFQNILLICFNIFPLIFYRIFSSLGRIHTPTNVVSHYESSMIHGSFIKSNFLKKQVYFNMHSYQHEKKNLEYNINLM